MAVFRALSGNGGGGGSSNLVIEQGNLAINQTKSFHTDNALVCVRHTPYGFLGDAKVVDGVLTILSSSNTSFTYNSSTQTLTFSENYSTGVYVIAYNDLDA